jgi:NTP pyrophosphatase (non-canonical NTP hydrolase)
MIYPRSRFVDTNGLFLQLEHIQSELKELMAAYWTEPKERVAEEAADLKHSVETLQRILQEKNGFNITDIDKQVIEKNRSRGYYD